MPVWGLSMGLTSNALESTLGPSCEAWNAVDIGIFVVVWQPDKEEGYQSLGNTSMYLKENIESLPVISQAIHDGEGLVKRRRLFGGRSRLPVKVEFWELDVGVSEGSHTHEGEMALEEIYCFQEGEGLMWVGDEDVPVQAGDVVLVPPGVHHGFRNTGAIPLKLLIMWGMPIDDVSD